MMHLLSTIKFCAKANPRKNAGATNQKPLTIKPYPMKIQNEYNFIW